MFVQPSTPFSYSSISLHVLFDNVFILWYTCRHCIMHMKRLMLNLSIFHNHSAWNWVSGSLEKINWCSCFWNCTDKVKCMRWINEWWGNGAFEKIPSGEMERCLLYKLSLKCERKLLPLCLNVWFLHQWLNAFKLTNLQKCKNIQLITKSYERRQKNQCWWIKNKRQNWKCSVTVKTSSIFRPQHASLNRNERHKPMSAEHIWVLVCAAGLP